MIAGFAHLGVQIGRVNGRIDQLSAKLDGLDVPLEVKFDAANARVDAVSEQLAVELQTMRAEIAAETNALAHSIVAAHNPAPGPPPPRDLRNRPLCPPRPAPVSTEELPLTAPALPLSQYLK